MLYVTDKVTPNMHLHMHILECILDFGPVYSFWLFSFERFNGILGEYSTSQRSVEIQIMRTFLSEQYVRALSPPTAFNDYFGPILQKMTASTSGTLQATTSNSSSCSVILQSLLSIGPTRKGIFWSVTTDQETFLHCLTPIYKQSISLNSLSHLKESYQAFMDNVNTSSVTIHCEIVSAVNVAGELYGSFKSRNKRSAYILAAWCGPHGRIDSTGSDMRPGVVQQFIRQNLQVDGQSHMFILAEVKWLQPHPRRHKLGAPVEVWCQDFFEDEGPADFISLQRIHGKFVQLIKSLKMKLSSLSAL